MARAYFHNLPSLLCKILGVYTVRFDNKETGKKGTENVVVMENIFYERSVSRTFDLKGSSRARYVELVGQKADSVDEVSPILFFKPKRFIANVLTPVMGNLACSYWLREDVRDVFLKCDHPLLARMI